MNSARADSPSVQFCRYDSGALEVDGSSSRTANGVAGWRPSLRVPELPIALGHPPERAEASRQAGKLGGSISRNAGSLCYDPETSTKFGSRINRGAKWNWQRTGCTGDS